MRIILPAILFIAIIFVHSASAGELEMRNKFFEESKNLFFYEEFNKLEQISQILLEKESKTPSGVWQLSILFKALRDLSDGAEDEERWRNILEKNEKWLFKYPDSSAALITKGNILISYAWSIRGTTAAHLVPNKNWPKFLAALNTAKIYMLSIKSKADHNPEWYISMIRISRGLGENEMDFKNLVKEALDKHPDYHELYFTLSEFLKPKWGGSIEKIENLANYGVEKTFETEGMALYARYYWYIYQNESQNIKEDFFKYYNLDWSKMKQGMYDILKKYPDPWNINNFAYFACAAKDKEATKDLIAKVKDHLLSVWETTLKFDNCRRWANGQPIEKPQEGSDLNIYQMQANQWFQQLSYVFSNEDYEQYRQGFIHFYDHNITKDYKRDFKIKYTSVCEKNDDPEELADKIQSMTQTKEEFFTAETSLKFQKGYNSYEHAVSNLSYNEDTRVISLGYNLKLAGHLEEVGGFAGSEVKAFPFDEFRDCSANFVYTEDNLLKMTKENCEILVQKGCAEKPKPRPKKL